MTALVRLLRVLITLAVVGAAVLIGRFAWESYLAVPWTRDGRVRAYVVTVAPEVAGRVVTLPIADNQYVRAGDTLFVIDDSDYRIALASARARLQSAQSDEAFRAAEARRRERLTDLSVSAEQQQQYNSEAAQASATTLAATAAVNKAELDLARTDVRSPVDGWVTNLLLRRGDYVTAGERAISLVDAHSYWVDGYFEETALPRISNGDRARVLLLGETRPIVGHVQSVARGIQSGDAEAGPSGLASVNPVFTWVRLAQRVPVRIAIDQVPSGVRLVAGTTASVEVHPSR